MPVSITTEGLLNALRLNLNEPMALEIGRLRAYAEVLVEKLAPDAPTSVLNQAMVQLVGYLFENPIGLGSMRQSGASETLAPYRGSNVSIPIPSGGLSANAILQLIAAHAAISAVHHVPGDAGVPGNIDDAAVQTLIDTHAQLPNIHHTPTPHVVLPSGSLASTTELRTAWLDGTNPVADDFTVANGAVIGTIDGTAVDRGSRYPGVDGLTMIFWYGSTDAPIILTFGAAGLNTFIYVGEITVDGVIGRAYRGVVTYRAALLNGTVLTLVLPAQSGDAIIATRTWVEEQIAAIMVDGGLTPGAAQLLIDAHARMANIHHTPPVGSGGASMLVAVFNFTAVISDAQLSSGSVVSDGLMVIPSHGNPIYAHIWTDYYPALITGRGGLEGQAFNSDFVNAVARQRDGVDGYYTRSSGELSSADGTYAVLRAG